MKHPYLKIHVLSLLLLVLGLSACKKDDKQKDPCSHLQTVRSTSLTDYYTGHFLIEEQGVPTYLYAENFEDYSAQIQPESEYQIAYKTVKCSEYTNWCGTGIAEGGCILNRKCIRITCLKPLPKTCFPSLIDLDLHTKSHALMNTNATIKNHSLKAKVTFSGCSANDPVKFKLVCRQVFTRCFDNRVYLLAKIIESEPGFTCQAVFTKEVCFDLNPIRQFYQLSQQPLPQNLYIRLDTGNGAIDLPYQP